MFENAKNIESFLYETQLIFPALILSVSSLVGITLSQLLFAKLRSISVRISGDYPYIQRAFHGSPLFGECSPVVMSLFIL